jgi:polysaccharide export outer membrane protein
MTIKPQKTRLIAQLSAATILNLACLMFCFSQLAGAQQAPTRSADLQSSGTIQIGAGDLLSVTVFDTPELSASVRVGQDGIINLPVVGFVNVQGMSTNQAARAIETAYLRGHEMIDPHVTVLIEEYASQGATISGEVKAPGVYPTLGFRTVSDLIALAGGLTANAGRTLVLVSKSDPSQSTILQLPRNPSDVLKDANPIVHPGDSLTVFKSGVVYTLGDLQHTGGFLVDNNAASLTVLSLLALSGGPTRTSALSQAIIIRNQNGNKKEIHLDLKHIMENHAPDPQIVDGDILVVPSSNAKIFGYRGIEAAIAIAVGLSVSGQL